MLGVGTFCYRQANDVMIVTRSIVERFNRWLKNVQYLLMLLLFTILIQNCQTKCGNYVIFEKCENGSIKEELFKEHKYESFKFKAPKSWHLEVTKTGDFVNYQLINENKASIKEDNIETFVITTTKVSKQYRFKEEFEKFVKEQNQIDGQIICGIETFEEHQFENKSGIYIAGTNEEINMKYERLAICILNDDTLYWLNSTSHSEKEENINICIGKEIISTFKTL